MTQRISTQYKDVPKEQSLRVFDVFSIGNGEYRIPVDYTATITRLTVAVSDTISKKLFLFINNVHRATLSLPASTDGVSSIESLSVVSGDILRLFIRGGNPALTGSGEVFLSATSSTLYRLVPALAGRGIWRMESGVWTRVLSEYRYSSGSPSIVTSTYEYLGPTPTIIPQ